MKKVIRLTESDLVRIVNKVIKESGYRTTFEGFDYWIDENGNYITFDPDLESAGYYDFEYEPSIEIDDIKDVPKEIRDRLFPNEMGEKHYNAYKNKYGKFKYGMKKDI